MSEKPEKPFRWRPAALTAAALALIGIGFLAGRNWDGGPPAQELAKTSESHAGHDPGEASEPTTWTCSMHPQIQLPVPGKCPICFMDLIPVVQKAEGEAVSLRQITLSATARRLARLQTAVVARRNPQVETRLVGQVEYDETRLGTVTAWISGRIDQLHVDFTGALVRKGQPIAEIYSPELYAAQAELIQALKTLPELSRSGLELVRESARRTEKAAREKLRLLGLTPEQIEDVARRSEPSEHLTLYAPFSGVVTRREVTEGMYVRTGSPIYTLADISRVWVVLEAYESDLPLLRLGQSVEFRTDSVPGKAFKARVIYVDPFLNEESRTVRVRMEAANPGLDLKPGMYVRAVKRAAARPSTAEGEAPLVVPATAPLLTGKRAVVYVELPGREGIYEGREVVLGPKAGDWFIVREGLAEGEVVVVQGAFKSDSALQIQAKPSMMNPDAGPPAVSGHDHGTPAMTGGRAPDAGLRVPAPFADGLRELQANLAPLERAAAEGDLSAARTAFEAVYDKACALDPRPLSGDAALLWRELAMRMKNDAVVGSDAADLGEARFMASQLRVHVDRAAGSFDLTGGVPEPAEGVPAEFRRELGALLAAYLPLAEALASDSEAAARKTAAALTLALGRIDTGLLPPGPREIWTKSLSSIQVGIDRIREAKDIDRIREGFFPLSTGLIAAVSGLGVDSPSPVFELYCPMAFDNKGAPWLQPDEEVRNPYFGAAMYGCGEVRRRLSDARG